MFTSWLNSEHLHYLTMSQIYECSWTFLLPWGLENDPANMNRVGEKELLLIRFQDEEESTILTQDSEDTVNKRNWQIWASNLRGQKKESTLDLHSQILGQNFLAKKNKIGNEQKVFRSEEVVP